jgi:AcrR family transcriptional regulator
MNRSLKKRTETALDELGRTYELVRELLLQRLEDIDTEAVRKQGSAYASRLAQRLDDLDTRALQRRGYRYAGILRKEIERRVDKDVAKRVNKELNRRMGRQQGPSPWPIAGLVVFGVGLMALGWALYDRNRREMMRQRLTEAQARARDRYSDLGGVGGAIGRFSGRSNGQDNGSLKARVEQAIAAGGTVPQGLETSVEGRTVYLRGSVDDPGAVDDAAERIHAVEGVVAVVNLTTGRPSSSSGSSASSSSSFGGA